MTNTSQKHPALSVIIPTKNEALELPKLLAALKRQTFRDFEIIVADAQSDDRTRAVAELAGAKIAEGGLPGFGRNAGAKLARGDVLLFLDADVVFSEDFLETALEEFNRRNLVAATCRAYAISNRFVDHVLHKFVEWYIRTVQYVDPHAGGFCIFVKRDVHKTVRGFNTSLLIAEDHDYVRRVRKHGKFRVLRGPRIGVSVRRLESEGRLGLAVKYAYYEIIQKLPERWQKDPWNYMQKLGGEKAPKTSGKK